MRFPIRSRVPVPVPVPVLVRVRVLALALALALGPGSLPAVNTVEWGGEAMSGGGLELADTALALRREGQPWEWDLSLSGGHLAIDYEPDAADLFGFAERVEASRVSVEAGVRRALGERWTAQGTVGASDGFTGYRSLWISRFYEQFFAGLDGLREPSPWGWFATGGGRWEYWKDVGFLESEVTLARETIAPGYDEVIDPQRGLIGVEPLRRDLTTWAWRVATENILPPRVRTRLEYRIARQSERELRQSLVGRVHFAPGRDWVLRLEAGGTHEAAGEGVEEAFRAGWIRGALEWQVTETWFFDLTGSHYTDNGEIENSIGFSSAAPNVTVQAWAVGVRYIGVRHWLRVAVGERQVDYAPVGFRNLFFSGLYRDRTFTTVQVAYNYLF